jgi:hypothetical protein
LKVTSWPEPPGTAVHWFVAGQATEYRERPDARAFGAGLPGAVGLNVTSPPVLSTSVHCELLGHATPQSVLPLSITLTWAEAGAAGSNVASPPA